MAVPARSPLRDPTVLAALLATLVIVAFLVVLTGWAVNGSLGAAPGPQVKRVDFAVFWSAARLAAEGRAGEAYRWAALDGELRRALGRPMGGAPLPFFYPPIFLMMLKPLGALSYVAAFRAWVAVSLGAYAVAALCVLRRPAGVLTALAAPGVLCCAFLGQNGFLTAAAMMAGLAFLPRRPLLGGCLLGLLAAKPHLAVLVPFALTLDRRWRALAACAGTAATLLAASVLVLGPQVLVDFARAAGSGGSSFADSGWAAWRAVQTVYGILRNAGWPPAAAMAVHAAAAAGVGAVVLSLWRRPQAPYALKAAALAAGTLLVTPYAFVYDTPILGAAAVFLLRDVSQRGGLTPAQAITATAAYLGPLVFYVDKAAPLTPPAAAALLAVAWLRARPLTAPRAADLAAAPA